MTTGADVKRILNIWRHAVVDSVRRDGPDLSARQMAILLTVYLAPPPHTVRGLAAALAISKPAVSRALDAMGAAGLVRRKTDERDRRSVVVLPTVKGVMFLNDFAELVDSAKKEDRP